MNSTTFTPILGTMSNDATLRAQCLERIRLHREGIQQAFRNHDRGALYQHLDDLMGPVSYLCPTEVWQDLAGLHQRLGQDDWPAAEFESVLQRIAA